MKNLFNWRLPSLSYNVLPMTPGPFVLIASSSDASESWETTQVVTESQTFSCPARPYFFNKDFIVRPSLSLSSLFPIS